MNQPKVTRPDFPPGYVDHPTGEVPWEYVAAQLTGARHYWLCSTRPDGRPHVVPRWCVYLDGRIYYDGSSETRHAQNIALNPHVALHLEDGDEIAHQVARHLDDAGGGAGGEGLAVRPELGGPQPQGQGCRPGRG